jgi:4-hydroxybutyrate CoA-transferase
MPPTFGDTSLRAETFQYLVEMPSGLPFYPEPALTDAMMRVGQNVAHLIDEGATIQTGMGEVPYAVLRALSGRKNLRFQSGILPEEVMALIEEGCFTGKACCNVTSARSKRFYDWLKMNPAVEIRSLDYTHDVNLMSQQPGFTSVNSAICVDLLGQVVLETLGSRQISGIGGALDYARASGNGTGKSIIAMTSTYGEEERTKIVPLLTGGEVVSLTRHDVNYVVTEFGVAELRYRSRQERARNLISVAHPKHREELERIARAIKLL